MSGLLSPTQWYSSVSELDEAQRRKYYDVLIANNIHFELDELGNYVADVRIVRGPRNTLRGPEGTEEVLQVKPYDQSGQLLSQKGKRLSSATKSQLRRGTMYYDALENSTQSVHRSHTPRGSRNFVTTDTPFSLEDITMKYGGFCALLGILDERNYVPNVRPVVWVLKIAEEIFSHIESELRDIYSRTAPTGGAKGMKAEEDFPTMTKAYFDKKYGVKNIVHMMGWDLLQNIQAYANSHFEVGLLASFLSLDYGVDEVMFMLQMHGILVKKLRQLMRSKGNMVKTPKKGYGWGQKETSLSVPVLGSICQEAGVDLFTADTATGQTYQLVIDAHLTAVSMANTGKPATISMAHCIHLALQEYRRSMEDPVGNAGPEEESSDPDLFNIVAPERPSHVNNPYDVQRFEEAVNHAASGFLDTRVEDLYQHKTNAPEHTPVRQAAGTALSSLHELEEAVERAMESSRVRSTARDIFQ